MWELGLAKGLRLEAVHGWTYVNEWKPASRTWLAETPQICISVLSQKIGFGFGCSAVQVLRLSFDSA